MSFPTPFRYYEFGLWFIVIYRIDSIVGANDLSRYIATVTHHDKDDFETDTHDDLSGVYHQVLMYIQGEAEILSDIDEYHTLEQFNSVCIMSDITSIKFDDDRYHCLVHVQHLDGIKRTFRMSITDAQHITNNIINNPNFAASDDRYTFIRKKEAEK